MKNSGVSDATVAMSRRRKAHEDSEVRKSGIASGPSTTHDVLRDDVNTYDGVPCEFAH